MKWKVVAGCLACMSAGMAGAVPSCVHEGFIVGIHSSRPDNANGWAIWISSKPFFDQEAIRVPSDLGGRLDLHKDMGRFVFSMAMNAMNVGNKVEVTDMYGTQLCDDFQKLQMMNTR